VPCGCPCGLAGVFKVGNGVSTNIGVACVGVGGRPTVDLMEPCCCKSGGFAGFVGLKV